MKPSPTEYALLKVLWAKGQLSAREIHEATAAELEWSFSSTRKTLERMADKGLVATADAHGVKVFRPGISKLKTIAGMMKDFTARVLEIDGSLPVTAFAESKILSPEELKELEELLKEEAGE
ncbi:MAG: BlaI/MecI/CopY family transcriptional regulator [Aquisalinus sp.]|nr:BlaI/MecI/CopY family transcriptional regulator [Aquisalinus sp.]